MYKVILSARFMLLLTFLMVRHCSEAQLKPPPIDYVPQSPSAANFSRYGEIPVSHSTGVPNIEIPIYTVKVGDVSIPITITYHASGIKVRDVASEVGLGFVLNTGNPITGTIIGKPDIDGHWPAKRTAAQIETEINNAYATNNATTINQVSENYWRLVNTQVDYTQIVDNYSDRFNYSLVTGESGVFRKDFVSGNVRLMPYRPIKVDMHNIYIDIVSQNGYKHFYTDNSVNKDNYRLDRVETPDGSDFVQYYYHTAYTHRLDVNFAIDWQTQELYEGNDPNICGTCNPCLILRNATVINANGDGGMETSAYSLLDSMVSRNEVIQFQYTYDRYDDVLGALSYPSFKRLTKIIIKDKVTRQTIKTFTLSHSYFGTANDQNRRLKLDNIAVSGLTNTAVENYSFNYETNTILPAYPHLNGVYMDPIWHEDYWGYYNGSAANNLLPYFMYTFSIPGNYVNFADMEPAWPYTKACMLTGINYPTGGKTLFEYEPNYLHANHLGGVSGGLRIKKITSYTSATSPAFVKTYEYDGSFYKPIVPAYYKWSSPEDHFVWYQAGCGAGVYGDYSTYKAFSNSLRPIRVSNGAPIIYTQVTEYTGDETVNTGKTVYQYSYPDDPEAGHPVPGSVDARYISYFHADNGNYVPQLVWQSTYKKDGAGYSLVRNEQHEYTKFHQNAFHTGISLASKLMLHAWGWFSQTPISAMWQYNQMHPGASGYLSHLVYSDTKAFEEVSLLTSSIVKTYSGSSYAEQVTTYNYDNTTTLLTQKSVTGSKGEVNRTDFKYPSDYPATAPYTTMVTRNILNPVVEQAEYRDNNFLQSMKTNFDYWNGTAWSGSPANFILPRTIESKYLTNSPEPRVRFTSYDDKGNATTVSKENDLKKAVLWGYNKTFVIASIDNADVKDVFHTSFEEGAGIGNSVFGDSKTGKISKLGGFTKSLTGLTNGNYTLSYWQKSSGSWVLQMSTVSVSSGSYTINLSGQLDEVRFYPVKAFMTTFTFSPLIGMLSRCSPDNRITYYEYDAFNRLALIRDQDRNIINKYCYTYAGQTEDCQFFSNSDMSGVYYKNCSYPYAAQGYYVSIPPGMFVSAVSTTDANNMALQYAQQEAEINDVCVEMYPLYYMNDGGTPDYVIELYNTVSGPSYYFYIPSGFYGQLGSVPAGTYNVNVYNLNSISTVNNFSMCGQFVYGQNYAYFPNVTISSSCGLISISIN